MQVRFFSFDYFIPTITATYINNYIVIIVIIEQIILTRRLDKYTIKLNFFFVCSGVPLVITFIPIMLDLLEIF